MQNRVYFTWENVEYVASDKARTSDYIQIPTGEYLQVISWSESLQPKQLVLLEVSPPSWSGTVKAMKKHKDIDNPYALAWSMKNKGYKPHYKPMPDDSSLSKGKPKKKKKYKKEKKADSFKEFFAMKEALSGSKPISNKDFINQVFQKHAPVIPGIDPERYPPIKGLEGPFSYRNGMILYYDPKEGKYYDKDRDMYLDNSELNFMN